MTGYTSKRIDELPAIMDGAVKLAGDDLGVQSFGLQVLDLPAGFAYPAHDHAEDGQEEVYVVLGGGGRVKLEDEIVELREWDALRVAPATTRQFEAGDAGLELLVIGGGPSGDAETIPNWWAD